MLRSIQVSCLWRATSCRLYSSAPSATPLTPPLLKKIREDLKTAMRAKDSSRLDVLRGLISDTTNASKTSNPPTTDSHILQIVRKRVKASEAAVEEAKKANRKDLFTREQQQISVLESYVAQVQVMSEEDIREAASRLASQLSTDGKKIDRGSLMKGLVGPGGALEGQTVEKKDVARIVDGFV